MEQKEQKIVYPRYELSARSKLIISKELQSQIDYYHKQVGSLEWIGVLYYTKLQGEISSPTELVFKAEKLLLMDIGTSGHTDAIMDAEEVCNAYDVELSIPGSRKGLIHTHHNMKCFFSNEDWDELNDNTPLYNYYLSLIVNFDGNYVAKVAYMAENTRILKFMDSDDQEVENQFSNKVMVVVDMNIEREVDQTTVDRYEYIKQKKEDARPKYMGTTIYTHPNTWKEEDFVIPKKEDQGEVGHAKTIFPGNPKRGGNNYYKHISDSLTYKQAKGICLDWLNEGLRLVSIDAVSAFSTISEGIEYFAEKFYKDFDEVNYTKFLADMQIALIEVSAEFQPSVVTKRVEAQMKELSYTSNTSFNKIAEDLASCGASHQTLIHMLRNQEKENRQTKLIL